LVVVNAYDVRNVQERVGKTSHPNFSLAVSAVDWVKVFLGGKEGLSQFFVPFSINERWTSLYSLVLVLNI